MRERTPCVIAGCGRSTKRRARAAQWICGKHWRCVDTATKARWREVKRALRSDYTAKGWAALGRDDAQRLRCHVGRRIAMLAVWHDIRMQATIADRMGLLSRPTVARSGET